MHQGSRPVDVWQWRAHYYDGTIIDELDGSRFRSWHEVDGEQVMTIELVPVIAGISPVMVEMPVGATPTVARLRRAALALDTGETTHGASVTILGWTQPDGSIVRLYCRDDGLVALTPREVT